MNTPNRRVFMAVLAGTGCASIGAQAFAQKAAPAATGPAAAKPAPASTSTAASATAAAPMLAENDPQAVTLGYKADTTKVDRTKFPRHDVSQVCGGCSLYQGKPTDAAAPCPLFAGKRVAGKGWCSAYVKRA